MPTEIIALIGTAIGTFGGILMSNKLTIYRIEQLEKKMDKHNTVIERMFVAEQHNKQQEDEIKCIKKDIFELWEEIRNL